MQKAAKLNSNFSDHYLNVAGDNGASYYGGNQGWWMDKVMTGDDTKRRLIKDKYYRLARIGCGTIAMSDVELYLTLQNRGYCLSVSASFDRDFPETGLCKIAAYRDYIEQMYATKYAIPDVVAGLHPSAMKKGLVSFLTANHSPYTKVKWSRYGKAAGVIRKQKILSEIERMLNADIPVVCAYHSFARKEIRLYTSLQNAKENFMTEADGRVTSHYMTIIGLYQYSDEQSGKDKYILEVVSWGRVYYIDYDRYAKKIDYFSNILSVY